MAEPTQQSTPGTSLEERPEGAVDPAAPAPLALEEDEGAGGVMTLSEHLTELRDRIVKALIGVAIGSMAGFFVAERVLNFFISQICDPTIDAQCRLSIIDPAEGLLTYFRIGLYIGVALALPLVVFQLIRFVSPGLTRSEKRLLYTALPFVSILFVVGAGFALAIVVPAMLRFLSNFLPTVFKPELRASTTLNLALNVTLWMGLVFEMPLVMFILTRFGLVTARLFLSWWRYALIVILIAAALITPTPDPFNMGIVALPMVVLYIMGIGLARLAEGWRPRSPAPPAPVTG